MDVTTQQRQIGEVLRAAREARNISQEHLAELCGASQTTISAYELGGRAQSWPLVRQILDAVEAPAKTRSRIARLLAGGPRRRRSVASRESAA